MIEPILILISLQLDTVESSDALANQMAAPVERVIEQAWSDKGASHASAADPSGFNAQAAGNEDWPLGTLDPLWNEDWPLSIFGALGNEDWPL